MANDANNLEIHLAHAFICEKLLVEKDGVPSYIRAIDQVNNVETKERSIGDNIRLDLVLVVAIRPGDEERHEKNDLLISVDTPSGKTSEFYRGEFAFAEENTACATYAFGIHLEWQGSGLYWFNVFVNNKHLGRIPLTLLQTH